MSAAVRVALLAVVLALVPPTRTRGATAPRLRAPATPTDARLVHDLLALPQRLWAVGATPDIAAAALEAGRAWRQGRPSEALDALRRASAALRAVLAREGTEGWERARQAQAEVLGVGARAALAVGRLDDLVYFLETARGSALFTQMFADAKGLVCESPDVARLEAKQTWMRTREARAFSLWRNAHATGSLRAIRTARARLDTVREQSEDLRRELDRARWCMGEQPLPEAASIHDLQGRLACDEVLVQYALLPKAAWALVVRPHRVGLVRLAPTPAILAAARALDISNPEVDVARPARRLAQLLVEPLGLAREERRLVLVPDGRIATVPFSLLLPRRRILLVPSGSVWLRMRADLNRRGVATLAVGGPDYGRGRDGMPLPIDASGQPPLPLAAAAREVRRVGDRVHVGRGATETALRRELGSLDPWSAVHIACHGLVGPTPERCALALAPGERDDGILTVPEIEDLEVSTDLVVLSACHSGEGPVIDPEGCVSIARAFLVAGAPCVLASLGTVDDRATEALMLRFHGWYAQDVPADEALRRAQAHVRAQPRWRHPRYWACWTLWGVTD